MKERIDKTLLSWVSRFIHDVKNHKNEHGRNILCHVKILREQNNNLLSHGSSQDMTIK